MVVSTKPVVEEFDGRIGGPTVLSLSPLGNMASKVLNNGDRARSTSLFDLCRSPRNLRTNAMIRWNVGRAKEWL